MAIMIAVVIVIAAVVLAFAVAVRVCLHGAQAGDCGKDGSREDGNPFSCSQGFLHSVGYRSTVKGTPRSSKAAGGVSFQPCNSSERFSRWVQLSSAGTSGRL